MRDFLIIAIVVVGCLAALRRPWIGALIWSWLSLMNPHRYAYGLAYDAPLSAAVAICTVVGVFATRDRVQPLDSAPARLLALFFVWITISWLAGLSPEEDYEQWKKVLKVFFMVFIMLALFVRAEQIKLLAWVIALSLGVLGVKGGVFTLLSGGNYRVWGPPGTFIEDNNEFGLALIMTVPLLRFLQMQVTSRWLSIALTAAMLLCVSAALGSYSRGALLAAGAMGLMYWWRGRNKVRNGLIIVLTALALVGFMPDQWIHRMSSIEDYEEDASALGRLSAWWTAFNVAKHYPFGIGFELARPELFAQYSPYPERVHAAHSIYFLVLGNHGLGGLALFLLLWGLTWRSANQLRRIARDVPQAAWCGDLAAMCQVSLLAFAVGGAFLSLSYFDLPYYLMVLVVVARRWVERRGWVLDVDAPPLWGRFRGTWQAIGLKRA